MAVDLAARPSAFPSASCRRGWCCRRTSTPVLANGKPTVSRSSTPSAMQATNSYSLTRPGNSYLGSVPNALALSPDGTVLYAHARHRDVAVLTCPEIRRRIPTGWYANNVSVSPDDELNVPSRQERRPNSTRPSRPRRIPRTPPPPITFALEKPALRHSVPGKFTLRRSRPSSTETTASACERRPIGRCELRANRAAAPQGRTGLIHVLADLPVGNGDPKLTLFPEPISPNLTDWPSRYLRQLIRERRERRRLGLVAFAAPPTTREDGAGALRRCRFQGLSYDYEGNNRFQMCRCRTARHTG